MDAKRPNILIMMTDDQGAWALRCAGNYDIQTPNLDRILENWKKWGLREVFRKE